MLGHVRLIFILRAVAFAHIIFVSAAATDPAQNAATKRNDRIDVLASRRAAAAGTRYARVLNLSGVTFYEVQTMLVWCLSLLQYCTTNQPSHRERLACCR